MHKQARKKLSVVKRTVKSINVYQRFIVNSTTMDKIICDIYSKFDSKSKDNKLIFSKTFKSKTLSNGITLELLENLSEDTLSCYKHLNDKDILKSFVFGESSDNDMSIEEFTIEDFNHTLTSDMSYSFGIKKNNVIIGVVLFTIITGSLIEYLFEYHLKDKIKFIKQHNMEDKLLKELSFINLGYYLLEEYRNHGYMWESLKLLIPSIINYLGEDNNFILVLDNNSSFYDKQKKVVDGLNFERFKPSNFIVKKYFKDVCKDPEMYKLKSTN